MRKLFCAMAISGAMVGQTISYAPPKMAVYTTDDGGATYQPLDLASGQVPISYTPSIITPYCTSDGGATYSQCDFNSGNSGTVTSFSAGNLTPLFTTSVATASTTPALSFTLTSQTANTVFAAPNGAAGVPTFRALVNADIPGATSSVKGAVIMPAGTTGNTLGTAAVYDTGTSGTTVPLLTGDNTWDQPQKFPYFTTSNEAVTFSATPTFFASFGTSRIELTGDVTSSTIDTGRDTQRKCFIIVQDSVGSHSFVWPTNVRGGMTIGSTASKANVQCFMFSTSDAAWLAESPGVINQ